MSFMIIAHRAEDTYKLCSDRGKFETKAQAIRVCEAMNIHLDDAFYLPASETVIAELRELGLMEEQNDELAQQ